MIVNVFSTVHIYAGVLDTERILYNFSARLRGADTISRSFDDGQRSGCMRAIIKYFKTSLSYLKKTNKSKPIKIGVE